MSLKIIRLKSDFPRANALTCGEVEVFWSIWIARVNYTIANTTNTPPLLLPTSPPLSSPIYLNPTELYQQDDRSQNEFSNNPTQPHHEVIL